MPTGENLRLPSRIVLTVGSDCAIGKMTVALELDRAARTRGLGSMFVPTGQTGIAIAGWGLCVDAVVSDFIAGSAERLVVEGAERGGELLIVEGQGSITHPAYSGVTLGLIHGSAPHAFVLCHHAGATEHEGFPGHPLTPLPELVDLHERLSLRARPATVAAIALNTRRSARTRRGLRSPEPPRRRASRPTIRCASARNGSWTRFSPPRLDTNTCSLYTGEHMFVGSHSSSSPPPSRSPSRPASRAAPRPPSGTSCVRATRSGASRRRTTRAIRARAIWEIEHRNRLDGPSIQPGQRIVLPSG